jgi:Ca2+-binding RTX toxin-like protein
VAGAGSEQLVGGNNTTVFLGGIGSDNLIAGVGTNYMQAGTGHDTFTFHFSSSGNATIYDFDPTLDHLAIAMQSTAPVTAASLASGVTVDQAGDAIIHLATSEVVLAGVAPSHVEAGWFVVT